MAGKSKNMSQIKQLLLLKKSGISNRKAADIIGMNKETVNNYMNKVNADSLSLDELIRLDDPILGKIGVCCYIKRAEESVRYTHSVVFILHWISINYGMPYIGFRFKIGACCYTCVKRYQTSIRNRSMLLQS